MAAAAKAEIKIADLPQVRDALQQAATLITDLRSLLQSWEPRVRCPQCGLRYSDLACGMTHASIMAMVKGEL
jgi:hypothetical protein